MTEERPELEGIVQIGEITTRVQKEVITEPDFRAAYVAGAVEAYDDTGNFLQGLLRAAGPYDDTRSMMTILSWLGDRIREVQPPATMEDRNA